VEGEMRLSILNSSFAMHCWMAFMGGSISTTGVPTAFPKILRRWNAYRVELIKAVQRQRMTAYSFRLLMYVHFGC
jgi:hypothetical protein